MLTEEDCKENISSAAQTNNNDSNVAGNMMDELEAMFSSAKNVR